MLLITTKTISPVRSLAPRMRTDVVTSGVWGAALSKSMEQSRHGEANSFSDSHETPLPNLLFIYLFILFFWGGGEEELENNVHGRVHEARHLCLARARKM